MTLIKFQVIAPDGRIGHKDIDWSTDQSTEMLAEIETVLDTCPGTQQVFVIVDLYSEVRKIRRKTDEKKENKTGEPSSHDKDRVQETYEVQPLWDV